MMLVIYEVEQLPIQLYPHRERRGMIEGSWVPAPEMGGAGAANADPHD